METTTTVPQEMENEWHDRACHSERNTATRLMVSVATVVASFLLPMMLLSSLLSGIFPGSGLVGAGLGFIAGGFVLAAIFDKVTIRVRQYEGVITDDIWSGNPIPYGPGLHARFPWEIITEEGIVSLRYVTVSYEIQVPTKDDEVRVKGQYQYYVLLSRLTIFGRADYSTVNDGFEGIVISYLSRIFGGRTAEETVEDLSLEDLNILGRPITEVIDNDELRKLARQAMQRGASIPDNLEEIDVEDGLRLLFGVQFVSAPVEQINFSDEVVKARSGQAESLKYAESTARKLGFETVREAMEAIRDASHPLSLQEWNTAYDRTLVEAGQSTLDITKIEGEAGQALTGVLAKFLGKQ